MTVPLPRKRPHQAYPGCYALSKVLEEVLLTQFTIQYGINGCCLRAPWIMEKDDFRYSLSFGDDVFGGPDWKTMVSDDVAKKCKIEGTIPILHNADGNPLKRNFVHVEDLVGAIPQPSTIPSRAGNSITSAWMNLSTMARSQPISARPRGLGSIDIPSSYHSTWLDNSKAKFELGWRPRYDLAKLIDAAWDYKRAAGDPRKVWYPG